MDGFLKGLLCALALGGLIAGPAAAAGPTWSDADRAAAAHALKLASGTRTLTIDLSDPLMARFLKRHYEISGMTADRYPGLHKLMAQNAKTHATTGVTGPKVTVLSNDITYEDLATLMLAIYPLSAPNNYAGQAAASMEAASVDPTRSLQIAYTSLCFYDDSNNPVGTCATQNAFGAGQYFPVNNTVTTAAGFTGVVSATYYDVTNQRYVAQISTLSASAIEYPTSQTISHPVIVNPANNSLLTALVCTSRSVNANANPGVCDYGTYTNTDVLVNMQGSVTYAASQTPQVDGSGDLVGTGSVSLVNMSQGGQCRLAPAISGTAFFSQAQVAYTPANKTLSWNFPSLDFGGATSLICGGDGSNIQFSLVLQVTDDDGSPNPIVAAQLSTAGVTTPHFIGPNAGALATPMLRLVAGCLHPDTLITMAGEAAPRPISKIKGEGELVRSIDGGQARVVGTVDGKDAELLVIRAKNGMEIKATAQHPFVMKGGAWRAAADLKPGDRVMTADGPAQIETIKTIAHGGAVNNLVLAHPGQAFTLKTESFYANGFLVGGHDAQQQLASARKAAPDRVKALLPKDFRTDYASHIQERKAS